MCSSVISLVMAAIIAAAPNKIRPTSTYTLVLVLFFIITSRKRGTPPAELVKTLCYLLTAVRVAAETLLTSIKALLALTMKDMKRFSRVGYHPVAKRPCLHYLIKILNRNTMPCFTKSAAAPWLRSTESNSKSPVSRVFLGWVALTAYQSQLIYPNNIFKRVGA